MKAAYDVIIACRNDSGKNAKQAFLTAAKDNDDLRQFLHNTYEQKINFFMKKIRLDLADVEQQGEVHFTRELMDTIVDTLTNRKKRGNAAKAWIANLILSLQGWEREMLELMIDRDVRAGFSESTINKIWAGLVTDVPYMRCCLPKDAKLKAWDWENGVYSQVKADGMFENVDHHEDGTVTMMSRAGSPMPLDYFADIVAEVKAKVPRGHRLNGELLMMKDGVILPRQIGNGHFNSLANEGQLEDREEGLVPVFDAWDIVPLEGTLPRIVNGKVKKALYEVAYEARFGDLIILLGETNTTSPIRPIEYKIVYSIGEAYQHYMECLERGLEGTVVKHRKAFWEDGTSKEQVKLKLEAECELEIVEFVAGKATGKNAALFGSILLKSKCGKLVVKCGTGFDDKLRKKMHEMRDQLIGTIVTVKSNFILPPENKETHSLFLPRFIEIRYDKKEADDLVRIQAQFDNAIKAVMDLV